MTTIQIDEKDTRLLAVSLPQDPVGNDLVREIPGRRFSRSRRCWVMPNTRESVVKIGKLFGKEYCRFDEAVVRLYRPAATAVEIEQATNPVWPPLSKHSASTHRLPFRYAPPMREYDRHPVIVALSDVLRVQNYSHKTYKNYKQAIIALIRYVGDKAFGEITKVQYQKYLLFLVEKKRYSPATLNVHINAWKLYQEKILGREKVQYDVAYPRQPEKLPTVYSVAEVKAIFEATTSVKYRTLFQLVYATGLRLSEVANLKLTDMDVHRRLITVRAGKGKKDRVVMLTQKMEIVLGPYLRTYQPATYLFEGE